MDLHDRLRTLAQHLGTDVFRDPDGLRGALDDYLDEESATTGEINVIIDAVRMGGLQRLLMMIENGAEPGAAVAAAGDSFARERGTEDLRRSRWACAVLGYAVGAVDVTEVQRYRTTPAEPQSPITQQVSGALAPLRNDPPPVPQPTVASEGPVAVELPEGSGVLGHARRTRGGARRWLGVAAIALATTAIIAVTVVLLDDGAGESPASANKPSAESSDSVPPGSALAGNVIAAQSFSGYPSLDQILTLDLDTGRENSLGNGINPQISPDRRSIVHLRATSGGSAQPYLLSVEGGKARPLVAPGSECSYSDEPSFSPSGDKLALVCERADGVALGLYVVSLEGEVLHRVQTPGVPFGAPTWISETTIVYSQRGADAKSPTTLWSINEDGTGEQQLTDRADRWDSNPDWSKNRQLLIFQRSRDLDEFGQIWVMVPGGRQSELFLGVPASEPVWSPSGDEFAFVKGGKTTLSFSIMTAPTDSPFGAATRAPGQQTLKGAPDWGSN